MSVHVATEIYMAHLMSELSVCGVLIGGRLFMASQGVSVVLQDSAMWSLTMWSR